MEKEPTKEKNKNIGVLLGTTALKGVGVVIKWIFPDKIYNKLFNKE